MSSRSCLSRAWNSSCARRSASSPSSTSPRSRAMSMRRCCEVVEVELSQRAVQVVGAADGPPRLHARELLHRRRRQPAQRVAVHGLQRVEQHRRQLLARHRRAAAAALRLAVLERALFAVSRRLAVAVAVDPAAEQREVDLEDGLERLAGGGGASPASRSSTALNISRSSIGDVLDRAHGVEVLRHRHRQPGGAQLVDEALEDVEQRTDARRAGRHGRSRRGQTTPPGSGTCSSLRALVMSDWYLSSTCSVSPMTVGIDLGLARGRAACAPSRWSPRSTAPSSARARGSSARRARSGRRAARRSRAPAPARSPSRARCPGSRCAGRGSGASAPPTAHGCCST